MRLTEEGEALFVRAENVSSVPSQELENKEPKESNNEIKETATTITTEISPSPTIAVDAEKTLVTEHQTTTVTIPKSKPDVDQTLPVPNPFGIQVFFFFFSCVDNFFFRLNYPVVENISIQKQLEQKKMNYLGTT